MRDIEIAIIGAGPAGITAGIQLKRASFNPTIFEKNEIGGLLINASLVENYPGFPKGISGIELVEIFKRHIKKSNIKIIKTEVIKIIPKKDYFEIQTQNKNYNFHTVIVATGTIPKRINVIGEKNLYHKKIFYEIKNLPKLNGNENFVIIGSGDVAFDYALNLAGKGISSKILYQKKTLKCLPLLGERAEKEIKIEMCPETKILKFFKKDEKIQTTYNNSDKEFTITSDFVLVAIGRKPNYDILPNSIKPKIGKNGKTEIPGLYLAGDVTKNYRQVGIVVGSGLSTAMDINDYINKVEK